MITNKYKIADKIIKITSIYEDIHKLCKDYLYCGTPDFEVKTDVHDIEFEQNKSDNELILEGLPPRRFSDGYLETLAIYRKIANNMLDSNCFLFHGSAVAVDGKAYVFTAKSGTGKSTHTALWRKCFGKRAVMINDDKPLIRIENGTATVYGTPWNGKHNLGCNISVELKAVCILNRGKENHIERIDKRTAFPLLLQQIYRPEDYAKTAKTLQLTDELTQTVPVYRLHCNMEPDAATVAYNAMKG